MSIYEVASPNTIRSPALVRIHDSRWDAKNISLHVLRLDTIHPFIGGNKWYKLKYNLEEFSRQKKRLLVTFGGAFSNHILATAASGNKFGFETAGIIRGDELNPNSNHVLQAARDFGMHLIFEGRDRYMMWKQTHGNGDHVMDAELSSIISRIGFSLSGAYFIPEGGANKLGATGCIEIPEEIRIDFDYICCACGTGTTLTGIVQGLRSGQTAVGIPVVKGEFQSNTRFSNARIFSGYHFGGFAKTSAKLNDFCERFFSIHQIPLEPVYTGKLFFAISDLIERGVFPENSSMVLVHSGGVTTPSRE